MTLSARHLLSDEQTLFFCVGAQKSGTTWLHDYLSSHPEVADAPLKEMNFFSDLHPTRAYARVAAPLVLIPTTWKRFRARVLLEHRIIC